MENETEKIKKHNREIKHQKKKAKSVLTRLGVFAEIEDEVFYE